MAKRIEFDGLLMEKLQTGSLADLKALREKVDLTIALRFQNAALAEERPKRGRPPQKSKAVPAFVPDALQGDGR